MKKIGFILWAALVLSNQLQARIFIDITESSSDPFPLAITQPYASGQSNFKQVESVHFKRIYQNLNMIGLFRVISPKAFLENQKKKSFDTKQIDFSNWAVLDTLGLVKSRYKMLPGNKVELTSRLYDVLLKKPILEKKYIGKVSQIEEMADRFSNEIILRLTGFEGFFRSKIAFICKNGPNKELCQMDFNGENVEQLTRFNSITMSPAWNMNGSEIFFTSFANGKKPKLFKNIPKFKKNSPVSSFPGMMIGVDVHPKTNQIMTTLTKDGNSELYLLNNSGKITKRFTTNRSIDSSGRFSPNGESITFNSDRSGRVHIYVMSSNGGRPKQLTFKGKHNTKPVFSKDGQTVYFAGEDTDGESDIFSVDLNTKKIVRLTYDSKDNIEPHLSPGGHMIVFASNRTGTHQLWAMRPDGSNQIQLSKNRWNHYMPAWGPNQK